MADAGTGMVVVGNHDDKLKRHLAWPQRQAEPRPCRDDRAARAGAARVRRRDAGMARRADQPLRARRRQAGGRPRRPEGGDAGPRLGRACAASACTARQPARSTSSACRSRYELGGRLQGQGHGRLWPHPGVGSEVGQRHAVHRHRLRVRRRADCAALSRARSGLGAGAADLLRADPPAGRAGSGHRPARPTSSTSPTCFGKQVIETAALSPRHRARGQRRGRARGDEPLRGRSALADLPAADDVAGGDERAGRLARAPRGGLRLLRRPRASRRSSPRRSTWARARLVLIARTQERRRQALRCARRRARRDRYAHRAAVLQRCRARSGGAAPDRRGDGSLGPVVRARQRLSRGRIDSLRREAGLRGAARSDFSTTRRWTTGPNGGAGVHRQQELAGVVAFRAKPSSAVVAYVGVLVPARGRRSTAQLVRRATERSSSTTAPTRSAATVAATTWRWPRPSSEPATGGPQGVGATDADSPTSPGDRQRAAGSSSPGRHR